MATKTQLHELFQQAQKYPREAARTYKPDASGKLDIELPKKGEDKLTFLERVQKFLGQIPPHLQIQKMNEIQDKVPYLLLDPDTKRIKKVMYGWYDLIAFVNKDVRADDPRNPFQYKDPSDPHNQIMNYMLALQQKTNPEFQTIYLQTLLRRISEEYGELPEDGMVSTTDYKILKRIADDIRQKLDSTFVPIPKSELAKYSEKQFNKHFTEFLSALQMSGMRDDLMSMAGVAYPLTHGVYVDATNPLHQKRKKGPKMNLVDPYFP